MIELAYLHTPYARAKEQESYDREYHSRLGGPGHQNAKEGSMIQRGRETAPDESAHHREAAVWSPAHPEGKERKI